jgi:muramoyltetrapeptide carboxypeptidase
MCYMGKRIEGTNLGLILCIVKRPPSLKKGDKIGLVAPARKISKEEIADAIRIIEDHGFTVAYSEKLFSAFNQFAGADQLRAEYFQEILDRDDIKAIISVRGGYGSVKIIDRIDFSRFMDHPKWIIGYSDLTVFLNHVTKNYGVETLHASMPLSFKENTATALSGLFAVLQGDTPEYAIEKSSLNRMGKAKGTLVGGNLSVLYSLMGSRSFPETNGSILFIEDLDEYLYHIERMMMGLKRAGIFDDLAGLIVGGMTDMNDNEIPFGKTAEEIIHDIVSDFDFPVCFGFPAGHIDNNLPLIMGAEVIFDVSDHIKLKF